MEKTIGFFGLQKVTYRFDKDEVKEALIRSNNIKMQNGQSIELEIFEGYEDEKPYVILILDYIKQADVEKKKS